MAALAAFTKVVIDRLRNQVANSTVFLGAKLLNERQFVGVKKDRRANQARAGNFLPLIASRRMSCDQQFVQHDFVPCVDSGNRLESSELEKEPPRRPRLISVRVHEAAAASMTAHK